MTAMVQTVTEVPSDTNNSPPVPLQDQSSVMMNLGTEMQETETHNEHEHVLKFFSGAPGLSDAEEEL